MILLPVFGQRDFSPAVVDPTLKWSVDGFQWAATGGPKQAQISASGGELQLWSLLDYLRCPVVIQDGLGRNAWWGMVNAITITQGKLSFGVSLDKMANSVNVAYSFIDPGSQTVGTRKTTATVTDADSITTFGTKELIASLSGATDAQAENIRDTILARQKYPISTLEFGSGRDGAVLNCVGWFDTLSWRCYANSNTTSKDTTAQIAAIQAASGQFLVGTDVDVISGVSSSEYRDGSRTALAEISDLLQTGTTHLRRLLASVNVDRRLQVAEEPAIPNMPDYYLTRSGRVQDIGNAFLEDHLVGSLACGGWAMLKDIIPATADLSHFADPSLIFIEEAIWSAGSGLTITPRDNPGYLDLGGIE